ncbi:MULTISPECIES: bifunctional DNA-formamidopyrimidine glycosylase/DNA-(apurinic or apyrimidinic site) lyase [Microbacterium]|uniref:Formamidopyrimidine-DNA glycosylase n=1 Tax=Microbacterium wangchenii TaxID=2541726 RepID=A0ABX5SSD2_9MICO|nr:MULTISPECIES: bifunctional DNA-formamidopyrimidine glycosylase/DNA-(apurinic or apyrimidinic site) lyase [Microbacterium]MCK6065633.1 bifunctional DNA-formamidopyrimidine glycosylase/DNA-(apurinic or apyrimidinic site) lyase [Microbacterium sp. EYE_512]QBR89051.1 bifunctional DNA-formamidopyrimidine glycosylase/DNA-(apurinic or apyrimidinic site) lyase [Microbacterium wangchenii]TFV81867.1 bifunctional DNA-formamidopyrimidine glycosylase/DNA-(apurinic or apyrimidinic site) lyase [Microbacteri
MPELPEVEVVRAGLEPAVTDARISGVTVLDQRALTRHSGTPSEFEAALIGRTIEGAARRGKFLWLPLAGPAPERPEALMAHLGMSGQLLLRAAGAPAERHERVRIDVDSPRHGELAVVFADQRTFGSLAVDALVPTPDGAPGGWGSTRAEVPSQAAHIARDPLDPAFDAAGFRAALAGKKSGIKRVLLDQTTVSGIGNIYADEALWAARLHPETPAQVLSTRSARRLLAEVRAVLEKALAEGGTSFDAQYVNVNGEAGYFAHSLNAYGRTGQPCPRCGRPIVRVSFMNRSSHYCPHCQRLPRPAHSPGESTFFQPPS